MLTAYAIILTFLGTVPGETTGWETGDVTFIAYVDTAEYQDIYPICAGQYTTSVSILEVTEDPEGALDHISSVDICYEPALRLKAGMIMDITGTYYNGACPAQLCRRVQATYLYQLPEAPPEEEENEDEYDYPDVVTSSAEATETTATLRGILREDGGEACNVRFHYRKYDENVTWHTTWFEEEYSGATFTQKIAGLIPDTLYYFYVEAENTVNPEWSNSGRTGSFKTLTETIAPIPNPVVWLKEPDQINSSTLIMTGDIARDVSGPEEYQFDFVSSPTGGAGGSDSAWQFSPIYMDNGLNPNHTYVYRVKARDGLGNETAYSPLAQAYTDIETPQGIRFTAITVDSIQAQSSTSHSGLSRGQSGLKLENTTTGQLSNWQQHNELWTSDNLLPNTQYYFRAQARNGDGDLTAFSPTTSTYTLATIPSMSAVTKATTESLSAFWDPNGNPLGTQYFCQNLTTGTNSSWLQGTNWLEVNLSANVQYAYRVKAINGNGVETAYSQPIYTYSAIEPSTGIQFGDVGVQSIQVRSENTPSGLQQDQSGLRFTNITYGQVSTWQSNNNYWLSTGLAPNTCYEFQAQTRNGDGVTTPYSPVRNMCTLANSPSPNPFSNITDTSIRVNWSSNGNPHGTLYRCKNLTNGTDSGWISTTSWDCLNLDPYTTYSFSVQARNANNQETNPVSFGQQRTGFRTLTLRATEGGKVQAPGSGTFYYALGSTVEVTAQALAGYHFLGWSGSAVDAQLVTDPNAASTTVLVMANYDLTATFLRTRIYVDARATGKNDGTNWENALVSLQDALTLAQRGNEIKIAQGRYTPDHGVDLVPGDYTVAFELLSGISVTGGYAGLGQGDPNERNSLQYETILSGDLDNNDSRIDHPFDLYHEQSRTDNSFHVINALDVDATTVLADLTISGGNSDDGAGLRLIRSSPQLFNCIIRGNRSGSLSGDGSVGWGQGAGLSCYLGTPVLHDCIFQLNFSGGVGGAIHSLASDMELRNCTFQANDAGMLGGAFFSEDGFGILVDCVFQGNAAQEGGAIYVLDDSHLRITNTRFLGNSAFHSGGALLARGQALDLINCLFSGNYADTSGGALSILQGTSSITQCAFSNNVVEKPKGGAALFVTQASTELINSIVWSNLRNSREAISLLGQDLAAQLLVSYCDVQGGQEDIIREGYVQLTWGTGNVDADPDFVNPLGPDDVAGTLDDDLQLNMDSPGIDIGDNDSLVPDLDDLNNNQDTSEPLPYDLNNQARIDNRTGIVDLGPFEF